MPAYVVALVNVGDPEAIGRYAGAVAAVTESFGGRYLFGGPGAQALEGAAPDAMAIIEFPTRADAERWYASAEYAPLLELRQQAGESSLILTPDVGGAS